MNSKKISSLGLAALIVLASPNLLLARSSQSPGSKCEDAIAQKLKAAENLKKVSFLNNTRRTIPHGPLTHYAGKGFYATPGGGNAEFEWFCDVTGADGKPENLYYEISKAEAPAAKPASKPTAAPVAAPAPAKNKVVADGSPVSDCQSAVASEIKKKNADASDLSFSPPKEFQAAKQGKLLEGDGVFKDKRGQEVKFDYRCLYDKLSGKIADRSFQRK